MTHAVEILDDDAAFRESLAFLLEAHGFVVTTHADPSTFMQGVADRAPDCLVCDIRMPGMSGVEVARALRAEGLNTRVILITGHADPALLERAAEAGATLVLEKPFPPQQLIDALNRLLG
ncbi:hypothetical protein BZG35_17385 [Brevundimonas sp. LM2]|uniref:response regulator transcription factor n=1 Tax=Brevundimonas sp. LM2 TaxID=1938605 RepID=UPI000983F2A7|nr:response regulator [Brevundimonas sp. LM2]AQR63221.1 hypothetical protein BZG35_17385 [Brevundimonas sp. LM2]